MVRRPRAISCSSASTPRRWRRLALGAVSRRRAVSPSLRILADFGGALCAPAAARRRRNARLWKSRDMMRWLGAAALPFLRKLEPEAAHRAAIAALKFARSTPPRCDPRLAVAAFGLAFPNPLGMAAGFDKDAQAPNGLARRRLRLRRDRHRDAKAADRQSAPAPVSPGRGRGADQSDGLQQRRLRRSARPARPTRDRWGSSASISAPTRIRPTASPTTSPASKPSATSRAISRSTFLRRTRRACAICSGATRSMNWSRGSSRRAKVAPWRGLFW